MYREPSPPEPEPEDTFVLAYGRDVKASRARLAKRALVGVVALAAVSCAVGEVHAVRRARLATAWSEAAACLDPEIEGGATAVRRRARDRQLAVALPHERWSWPRSCWSSVSALQDRARAMNEPVVAHKASLLRGALESPSVDVEPFGDALVALATAVRDAQIPRRPVPPYAGLPSPVAGVIHRDGLSFFHTRYPSDLDAARTYDGLELRGRDGRERIACSLDAVGEVFACAGRPTYAWDITPVAPCGRSERMASRSVLMPSAVDFGRGVTVYLDPSFSSGELTCDEGEGGEDVAWLFERDLERVQRCVPSGCTQKTLRGLSPRFTHPNAPLEDLVVTHEAQITVRAYPLGALGITRRPVDAERPDLGRVVYDDRPARYADAGKRVPALSLVRVLPMTSSYAVVVLGFGSTVAFLRLDLATLGARGISIRDPAKAFEP